MGLWAKTLPVLVWVLWAMPILGGVRDDVQLIDQVFNFASHTAGAVIIDKSPSTAKGFHNLLNDDKDKYGICSCNENKWVVVGLAEDILITSVAVANYEKYSSMLKDFELLASTSYPSADWINLGTYRAEPRLGEQRFNLTTTADFHTRFLKVRFLTHYLDEALCTLSQIKVYGVTVIASLKQEVEMSRDHLQILRNEEEFASRERPASTSDAISLEEVHDASETVVAPATPASPSIAGYVDLGSIPAVEQPLMGGDNATEEPSKPIVAPAQPTASPVVITNQVLQPMPPPPLQELPYERAALGESQTQTQAQEPTRIEDQGQDANQSQAQAYEQAQDRMIRDGLVLLNVTESSLVTAASVDAADSSPIATALKKVRDYVFNGVSSTLTQLQLSPSELLSLEKFLKTNSLSLAGHGSHVPSQELPHVSAEDRVEFIEAECDNAAEATSSVSDSMSPASAVGETAETNQASSGSSETFTVAVDIPQRMSSGPLSEGTGPPADSVDIVSLPPESPPALTAVALEAALPSEDIDGEEGQLAHSAVAISTEPAPTNAQQPVEIVAATIVATPAAEPEREASAPSVEEPLSISSTTVSTTAADLLSATAAPSTLAGSSDSTLPTLHETILREISQLDHPLSSFTPASATSPAPADPGVVAMQACIDHVKFQEFHSKTLAKIQAKHDDVQTTHVAMKDNNIFKQLMQRIKDLEMNEVISEMFISQLGECVHIVAREVQRLQTEAAQTATPKRGGEGLTANATTTVNDSVKIYHVSGKSVPPNVKMPLPTSAFSSVWIGAAASVLNHAENGLQSVRALWKQVIVKKDKDTLLASLRRVFEEYLVEIVVVMAVLVLSLMAVVAIMALLIVGEWRRRSRSKGGGH